MTRRLPEPEPELSPQIEGRRKAHAALDEILDRAICERTTGRGILTVDFNEGGIRNIRKGSEEIFKDKPG